MPQLNRINTISGDEKKLKTLDSIPLQFSPSYLGSSVVDINGFPYLGTLTITTTGTAYNVTPNVSFTANVQIWGAGGAYATGSGGGGGFTTGIVQFEAGVSYNVVVGTGATSLGGAGGGSGIEYLANSNPLLIAGGGGGGGTGAGGAGGGVFAANGAGGAGATSYGAASPGTYRTGGGVGFYFGMGYGGGGAPANGGGGMYGGASQSAGGGGGSGWVSTGPTVTAGNTITGSGSSAANPNSDARIATGGNYGNAANNGLIVITVLNT